MESILILEAAEAAGVSTRVLRVIADSLDRVLPDLNRALNEASGLDGRKVRRSCWLSQERRLRRVILYAAWNGSSALPP